MAVGSSFTRWLTSVRRATAQLDAGHSFRNGLHTSGLDPDRVELLRERLEQQAYFRRLMEMTCGEVMRTPVTSVTGDQTIGEALGLLDKRRVKLLPVIDAEHRLVGVVTRADLQPLATGIRSDVTDQAERERRALPVRSVMSTAMTTVDAATRVADVIHRFTAKGHHHMPVVLDDNELVGMLTQSDIVAVMCRRREF